MRSVSQSYLSILLLFFFKQKTAYEMRISDWSSDVCSSDLQRCAARVVGHDARSACRVVGIGGGRAGPLGGPVLQALDRIEHAATELTERRPAADHAQLLQRARRELEPGGRFGVGQRSEEHTSELQSLMRISYAVFCLKKKKNYKHQ